MTIWELGLILGFILTSGAAFIYLVVKMSPAQNKKTAAESVQEGPNVMSSISSTLNSVKSYETAVVCILKRSSVRMPCSYNRTLG